MGGDRAAATSWPRKRPRALPAWVWSRRRLCHLDFIGHRRRRPQDPAPTLNRLAAVASIAAKGHRGYPPAARLFVDPRPRNAEQTRRLLGCKERTRNGVGLLRPRSSPSGWSITIRLPRLHLSGRLRCRRFYWRRRRRGARAASRPGSRHPALFSQDAPVGRGAAGGPAIGRGGRRARYRRGCAGGRRTGDPRAGVRGASDGRSAHGRRGLGSRRVGRRAGR
jgi:hypothetical protein